MGFRDLNLKSVYRSENDNLLTDFYIPVLSVATTYDRAVGYFSSGVLSYAAKGMSAFIKNGGRMRLIIGKELLPEEIEAVMSGHDLKSLYPDENSKLALIESLLVKLSNIDPESLNFSRIAILSQLISANTLEIKIALKTPGMFHEKIGVVYDEHDDFIVFTGSANETPSALLPIYNQESINVFKSWISDHNELYKPHVEYFSQLWNGETRNTLVIDLPTAVREQLIEKYNCAKLLKVEEEIARQEEINLSFIQKTNLRNPCIPNRYEKLRPHQTKALRNWQKSNFKGILEMCTGAGKTITSICGAIKIFDSGERLFLIITVPYITLAEQWVSVLAQFNIFPTRCWNSKNSWESVLKEKLESFRKNYIHFHCVVVVNKTLQGDAFKEILLRCITGYKLGENMMWVGDECHNHATKNIQNLLMPEIKYVMGLSATVGETEYQVANKPLGDFYGEIVDTYGLQEALNDDVLTPYIYNLETIYFEDDEAEKYIKLSEEISKIIASTSKESQKECGNKKLDMLLFERARLLGSAKNKFKKLREILDDRKLKSHILVYCGDGRVEDDEFFDEIDDKNGVNIANKVLYELGYRVSKYTYDVDLNSRREILRSFEDGDINAITAVRCLDEGLDIPAIKYAFLLASSRNPRQFIQRRGRVLRKFPGKTHAEIFDFFVKLPEKYSSYRSVEKGMIRGDLKRIYEFAKFAKNSNESTKIVEDLSYEYGITDFTE